MSQDWGNQQPGPGGNPPWGQPGNTPPWAQQPGAGGNPPWAQPGSTPPWAPGAGGGQPPGQRPPSKKPVGLIVGAVAAVLVVGGIVALVASGGGDDDDDVSVGTDRESSQSDDTDDTDDTEPTDDTDDTEPTDDTDDTEPTDDTDDTQATDDTEPTDDTGTIEGELVLGVSVTHPFVGDLAVRLEVYDADDQLLCESDLVEATGQPSEEQTVLLDPSDCAAFYPPGPDQRWFVGVADLGEADEGTLDEVGLLGPDGDFYAAFGLPVALPDADPNGVYVELTA
jgi:hypothetical protein